MVHSTSSSIPAIRAIPSAAVPLSLTFKIIYIVFLTSIVSLRTLRAGSVRIQRLLPHARQVPKCSHRRMSKGTSSTAPACRAHVALLKIDYHNRFPIAFVGLAANKQALLRQISSPDVFLVEGSCHLNRQTKNVGAGPHRRTANCSLL